MPDIRICIDVDDVERALRFYVDGLGLRVGRRLANNWIELLGAAVPIDLLCTADGSDAGGGRTRTYARHWTPVHLDFVVDDIAAAAQQVAACGGTLESSVQSFNWGTMVSLADPFGNGVDLIQYSERGYDALLDD